MKITFTYSGNSHIALTEPPFDELGNFLTMEGRRLDSWVFKLLDKIDEANNYSYAGNAYSCHIIDENVLVSLDIFEPPIQIEIPRDEFKDAVTKWKNYLSIQ